MNLKNVFLYNSCRTDTNKIIWHVDIISDKSTKLSEKTIFSNYVDLSDHYVDLSENHVDYIDVDMSDINLTSRWQLVAVTRYENKIFSY